MCLSIGLNWLETYGKSGEDHKFWAFSWAGFFVYFGHNLIISSPKKKKKKK